MTRVICVCLAVLIALAGPVAHASACVTARVVAPPPPILIPLGGGLWLLIIPVTIRGPEAHLDSAGKLAGFCACGLQAAGVVASVQSVTIEDESTGDPITAFNFSYNGTTSASFAANVGGANWNGFHSSLNGSVTAGTPALLKFVVSAPGASESEVKASLQGQLIGVDGANADGTLANEHLDAWAVDFAPVVPAPASSWASLLGLVLLLAGSGWAWNRRGMRLA